MGRREPDPAQKSRARPPAPHRQPEFESWVLQSRSCWRQESGRRPVILQPQSRLRKARRRQIPSGRRRIPTRRAAQVEEAKLEGPQRRSKLNAQAELNRASAQVTFSAGDHADSAGRRNIRRWSGESRVIEQVLDRNHEGRPDAFVRFEVLRDRQVVYIESRANQRIW